MTESLPTPSKDPKLIPIGGQSTSGAQTSNSAKSTEISNQDPKAASSGQTIDVSKYTAEYIYVSEHFNPIQKEGKLNEAQLKALKQDLKGRFHNLGDKEKQDYERKKDSLIRKLLSQSQQQPSLSPIVNSSVTSTKQKPSSEPKKEEPLAQQAKSIQQLGKDPSGGSKPEEKKAGGLGSTGLSLFSNKANPVEGSSQNSLGLGLLGNAGGLMSGASLFSSLESKGQPSTENKSGSGESLSLFKNGGLFNAVAQNDQKKSESGSNQQPNTQDNSQPKSSATGLLFKGSDSATGIGSITTASLFGDLKIGMNSITGKQEENAQKGSTNISNSQNNVKENSKGAASNNSASLFNSEEKTKLENSSNNDNLLSKAGFPIANNSANLLNSNPPAIIGSVNPLNRNDPGIKNEMFNKTFTGIITPGTNEVKPVNLLAFSANPTSTNPLMQPQSSSNPQPVGFSHVAFGTTSFNLNQSAGNNPKPVGTLNTQPKASAMFGSGQTNFQSFGSLANQGQSFLSGKTL